MTTHETLLPLSVAEREEIKRMRGEILKRRAPKRIEDFTLGLVTLLERAVADIERLDQALRINQYERS